jgi:hypothetical protein
MGNGNSALYYLTDKGGYLGDGGAAGMKISLGSVTLASWTSGSQNTYYQDVYVDVNDYMQATAHIECLGIDYATSNPTSSADGYNVFVVYTSPSVANFTWDEFDYSSSYFGSAKIWNSSNDGASSGLDADLLDGNHASAFALASHTHSEYYPSTGGTLTGDLTITKDSPWISINKQGSAITTQEGGIRWQYKGTNIFYFYSDNADDGSLKIQSASVAGESDATPRLIIPRSNKDLYLAVSGGNVGIGTTSPSYRLHVADSTASGRAVFGYQTATSGNNYGAVFAAEGSGADKNIGLYATAQGATANYAALFDKGNVGIGTTTPVDVLHVHKPLANTRLVIGNNAAYDQFIYFQGNTDWSMGIDASNSNAFTLSNYSSIGTSTRLVVTTGGNVGIGTTSPTAKLNVVGGSSDDVVAKFKTTGTGTSDFAEVHIYNNNDDTLVIGSIGSNYANSNWAGARYIYASSGDLMIKTTSANTNLRFYTAGASNERMRIDASGNVGIGTTTPALGLHVADGKGFIVGNSGSSGSMYVSPSDENTINGSYGIASDTGDLWLNYRGYQDGWSYFRDTRIGNGKGTAIVMVDGSAGNVGIGTTSPSYTLDVNATSIRPTANLLLGEAAYSVSASYVGLKTTFMSGSNDYMILSGKSDGSTYISAKNGDSVYIRGGGNLSSNQIVVPDSNYINVDTTTLYVSGAVSVGSNFVIQNGAGIYSIKSTINTSASGTAFRIANTNDVQAARVTFVAETANYQVAKIYEVVKAGTADPVAFKVVDTGPSGEDDFSVAFSNDGGDLLCTVTNGSANESLTLVTTIFVGGSNTSQTVSNS